MFVVVVVKFLFFSLACMKMVEKEIFVCFLFAFFLFVSFFRINNQTTKKKKDFVIIVSHRFFISKRE